MNWSVKESDQGRGLGSRRYGNEIAQAVCTNRLDKFLQRARMIYDRQNCCDIAEALQIHNGKLS